MQIFVSEDIRVLCAMGCGKAIPYVTVYENDVLVFKQPTCGACQGISSELMSELFSAIEAQGQNDGGK